MTINETLEAIKSSSAELYFIQRQRGLDITQLAESYYLAWQKTDEAKKLGEEWFDTLGLPDAFLKCRAIETHFVKAIEEAIAYEERIN